MLMIGPKLLFLAISIIVLLGFIIVANSPSLGIVSQDQKKKVTITAILDDQGDPPRLLKWLFQPAIKELETRHQDLEIKLDYRPVPYLNLHEQILKSMANQTPVDLLTVDYIWLGEFAEKGFLTDLTNYTKKWERSSDWYQGNWDGGVYKDKIYGIWTVVDVRGLWYWKDMLNRAGVDPNSIRTWNGYIEGAKKLNSILRPEGIEGVHLVGASHSPDIDFYPYLWMLGGDIIAQKPGHPTKGDYWFPIYNSSKGVRALEFIKAQIDAGIKPQKNHFWGEEFANRKFAVMLEGPWVSGYFPHEQWSRLKQKVGFIPLFPVPSLDNKTSTLMGGWEFSIPSTSSNKNLAWELIEFMLEPQILTPWIAEEIYLPTQISLGEGNGSYANFLRKSIPFYDDMISMIPLGKGRPSIPEYPAIAEDIREALDGVYYGKKDPKQALDEAAAKSAKSLGW